MVKKHRKWLYYTIAIAVVVGIIVVRKQRASGDKPIIQTAVVERGDVTSSVSANGVLQPLTTVEVKSNVGGQVMKLAVDEGDEIKAGQLIAKIDPTDSLTALQQGKADLAAAVSKVDQARQGLVMQHQQNVAQIQSAKDGLDAARARLAQAEEQARVQPSLTSAAIKQAKSNLAAAEASYKQTKTALVPQKTAAAQAAYDQAKSSYATAESDMKRQKELLDKGFVSKSQVEASEEKFDLAKAQLNTCRIKLETAKDETEQDLSTAEAKVEQAKAQLDNATANSIQDSVKKQDVLSARAAFRQAEAALQVALASSKEDKIKAGDIIQADSQVERSEATVKNANTQLGYTTVVAPRAGIVTKKYVEEGSIVTAGRSSFSGSGSGVAIVDIADVSRMFAQVNVDETDIAQIEIGQAVDITVEAYPDEIFEGKVTKIAPQAQVDQNVTTIPVTVELDMPDKRLRPNMNVTCDFITGKAADVLMVPNEAVKESDSGTTVTVMKGDKQLTRTVEAGIVGTDTTEIKSGLKEGEKVVTAVIEPTVPGSSGGMSGRGMGAPGGMGGFGGGGMGMGRH